MQNTTRDTTFFRIFLSITNLLVFCACNSSNPDGQQEKDLEILVPKTGYTYPSYDSLYIVVKFNPAVAAQPQWQYSIDSGKTWSDMSFFSRRTASVPVDDDPFEYDVHRWIPEEDSLANIAVYLKANSYGNSSLFDIVGPVYIE